MLTTILEFIVTSLEIVGIAIILLGVLRTIYMFGWCVFKRIRISTVMTEIRMDLSNYLVLSLEVIIGRDIIETFLSPSINDIIILVALVLLRTLLAFFLNYEITHMPKKTLDKALEKN
ncbi:DUF1622 domain-containing protein [Patescibacteria group bacterium]